MVEFQRQKDHRQQLREDYETNHRRRIRNDTLIQRFILVVVEKVVSHIIQMKVLTTEASNADIVLDNQSLDLRR